MPNRVRQRYKYSQQSRRIIIGNGAHHVIITQWNHSCRLVVAVVACALQEFKCTGGPHYSYKFDTLRLMTIAGGSRGTKIYYKTCETLRDRFETRVARIAGGKIKRWPRTICCRRVKCKILI